MKNFRKILLSQNNLAKTLGITTFFSATKFNHHLSLVKYPEKLNINKALVLSPHPDDDVFGVGGTIARLEKEGTLVTVAYFCDGSGGIPEKNKEPSLNIKKNQSLIEVRRAEAKKSANILGYDEQTFFGYHDGRLAVGTSAVRAIRDLICRIQPDIIFVPSFLDNHPDHRATNEILINALSEKNTKVYLKRCETKIWAYEIWTPIFPNRIVDITSEINRKKQAIQAHVSQLESRKYDKAILGLNQYRAQIFGLDGFAEAFFATTPEIYKKLYFNS